MRLVIDMQSLQTESKYRGIGHYSFALIKELVLKNKNHEIYVVINGYDADLTREITNKLTEIDSNVKVKVFSALANTAEVIPNNIPNVLVSEIIRESFVNSLNPDFLLITSLFEGAGEDFVVSIGSDRKYKIGIIGYDLIPLSDKKKYLGNKDIDNWYQRKLMSVINADYIYAISESAKREFQSYLDLDSDNIINISSACESIFGVIDDVDDSLTIKYDINKKFILYSGALDERKNIKGLLEAFSKLNDKIKNEHQILLVGKYSEIDRSALLTYAVELGISQDTIRYTGFISTEDLAKLYNLCRAFVFPSFHEGFGLPLLEAMSCGAPAISSNCSSLPEVMGDDDGMFDPKNVSDMSEKIHLVLMDEQYRKHRKERGLKQSERFSWDKTANTLLNHIETNIPNVDYSDFTYEDEYKSLINRISKIVDKYSLSDDVIKKISQCIAHNEIVLSNTIPTKKFSWRIEGPFDSSYSLALLNRETARALKSIGQEVVLFSTEGPGDFLPNPTFLEKNPDIYEMYSMKDGSFKEYDIVSRNLYPPRVTNMQGKYNILHHYAWEESGFPYDWVENFNDYLSGMTCLSNHVKKIMIDNGVMLPLYTSGCGVDHWNRVQSSLIPFPVEAKTFKFLHVSSCFPRKGVDVLLESYGRSFTREDDVSLIIKTFDNPHNEVLAQLEKFQREDKNFPHVVIIKKDLTNSELKSVYEQCDVLVSPSKAEGFGLPMAEAILSGLPVITTGWGGQRDFCTPDNSWLVDYEFEAADTHFELFDSVWACPTSSDLAIKLREVFEAQPSERQNRTEMAKKLLASEFTWEKIAINLVNQTEKITTKICKDKYKIGWVSSWNQKCGIATYSEHLVEQNKIDDIYVFAPKVEKTNVSDCNNVERCWLQDDKDNLTELYERIIKFNVDIVVIQMNYYFFDYPSLSNLIVKLKRQNIVVFLTLHSTQDPEERKKLQYLAPTFKYLDRIMVHSINDLNRLKSMGLVDNVLLLPHGIVDTEPSDVSLDAGNISYIASYGFALPHKGIEQLVDAFNILSKVRKNLKLLLINAEHPDPISKAFIDTIHDKVAKLKLSDRVVFKTDFLSDDISLGYLNKAEVIVMPYQNTGESSSGAVKMAIASGTPVFVTPLDIFDDVYGAVEYLDGFDANAIAKGIQSYNDNPANFNFDSVKKWRTAHSYSMISDKLFRILRSLYINRE